MNCICPPRSSLIQRPVVDVEPSHRLTVVEGASHCLRATAVHRQRPHTSQGTSRQVGVPAVSPPSAVGRVIVDSVRAPLRTVVRRRGDVGHVVALAEAGEVPTGPYYPRLRSARRGRVLPAALFSGVGAFIPRAAAVYVSQRRNSSRDSRRLPCALRTHGPRTHRPPCNSAKL